MRIYKDFPEAQNEIKRDLAELGVSVHPETMQDIYVADNPQFETKELSNYIYQVIKPDYTEIEGVHDNWVKQEWEDRLVGDLNPGRSWKLRKDIWEQFLKKPSPTYHTGRFSYTYSERMGGRYIQSIIDEIMTHPTSRQLYLPVWDRQTDWRRRGELRVPCSLGYWFVVRTGDVHLTYMMRSCDIATHYPNDIALATILQHYIAQKTELGVGTFTHFIGSLHVYAKDVADVF
jgi:thymidylate synthase